MATAKDIVIKQIDSKTANDFVRCIHYSGKVCNNSQLHLGVFLDGKLEGAMQFGPSLDKRKIQGLVSGTQWHEFLELNRMAFSDNLPRNSESRALGIAFRLIKKYAPQVKWIISFADGTQCGDGTIYRAAGFILTAIKKNNQIWEEPDSGARFSRTSLTDNRSHDEQKKAQKLLHTRIGQSDTRRPEYYIQQRKASDTRFTETKKVRHAMEMRGVCTPGAAERFGSANGAASMRAYIDAGWKPKVGFQLRYIYFLDPSYRERLTVPEIPFSEIEKRGAKMYKGVSGGTGEIDNAAQSNAQTGGASTTVPLLEIEKANAINGIQNG